MTTINTDQFFLRMKRTFSSALIALVLSLSACEKTDDAQLQGGVDGSGGEMNLLSEDVFKTWTEKSLKYALRDVIHRLSFLQKNPGDLGSSEDLVLRLFGESPEDLQSLLVSIDFIAVKGPCSSTNRPHGDASALPNRKICFSYEAFKRFEIKELPEKMIPLALHELSHFRGFDEADATKLQQLFINDYGIKAKVILQSNAEFKKARENVFWIVFHLNMALGSFITTENSDAKKASCENLSTADNLTHPIIENFALPKHIYQYAEDRIYSPLRELSEACDDLNTHQYTEKLVELLKNAVQLSRDFEFYTSPNCIKDHCPELRFKIISSAEERLLKWETGKKWFLSGEKPPEIDISKIKCVFEDLNLITKLEFSGANQEKKSIELTGPSEKMSAWLYPQALSDEGYPGTISISGLFGDFQILEANGFIGSPIGLHGWLVKGVREKASVHFKRVDWTESAGLSFYLLGFEYYLVGPEPKLKGEYKLTCELSP